MDSFNLACDYIAWHNFGTEWFVILGRDMGIFFMGYLACFIINAFVEVFRREKKNDKRIRKIHKRNAKHCRFGNKRK